ILASIGILALASLFTLILIFIFDRCKNKRVLRYLRIGAEIREKGSFTLLQGIVVHIDSARQEVV
ncbi:hypothetical protein, partial [Klebsiella pneumoniae]|uniref:hypothetical protein n=1 Tax=Klebsiella pneumoniae TaxID=573 RepID=UPI001A8F84C8